MRPNRSTARLDQRLGAVHGRDVVGVGHGGPAGGDDLVDGLGGRPGVRARAAGRGAEVVDDDAGAALGQQACVGPADAAPGAGDDGDPPVEAVLAQRTQTPTGASPSRSPSVPPTMALRSSSGTPAISDPSSSWLPRNVPSAWG